MDFGRGGAEATISEDVLHEAMARMKFARVDVIIDARKFPDPHAPTMRRHIGKNPAIMAKMSKHKNFRWFLRDVKYWLQSAVLARAAEVVPGSPIEVVLAVYCRAGKHRSVAVAEFLKHIFVKLEGFKAAPVP